IERGTREVSRGGASRRQILLKLVYALTVHRAQGLTLANVAIPLQGFFCHGQEYVALSRCRRLQDLHIIGDLQGVDLWEHQQLTPLDEVN
ncbi:hypothetical protein DFQ26_009511, partial [Actinomortierella ambigua]